MTPDFWKQIQPQLDAQIANALGEAQDDQSLYDLLKWNDWWELSPFDSMKLKFKRMDGTFIQWIDAAEMYGEDLSEIFEKELIAKLKNTIEHQYEIWLKEGGEKLAHELKEVA